MEKVWIFSQWLTAYRLLWKALNEVLRLLHLCTGIKGKLKMQFCYKIQALGQTGFGLSSVAFLLPLWNVGTWSQICSLWSVQLLFLISVDCSWIWVLWGVLLLFLRCIQFITNIGNCGFGSYLDLWYVFRPKGANQNNICLRTLPGSGLSVKSKSVYSCFPFCSGLSMFNFHWL